MALGEIGEDQPSGAGSGAAAGFAAERVDTLARQMAPRRWHHAARCSRRGGRPARCGAATAICICATSASVDGKPTLFDCIEFSETIASIDVLYDLAFLLMDLEHRGLPRLANLVFNRYLDRTGEDAGLAAMPLFLSLRAGIRAHVTATALPTRPGAREQAADMCGSTPLSRSGASCSAPQPRRLVAIGGSSGSGKSTLAMASRPSSGLRPGARVLRSDVARKLLLGAAPRPGSPAEAYAPEITRRVYDALCEKAATALAAGYSAIIDAVSLAPEERRTFAEVARRAGVPFSGLWLEAGPEGMAERIRRPPGRCVRRHPGDIGAPAAPGPGHDRLDPDRRRRWARAMPRRRPPRPRPRLSRRDRRLTPSAGLDECHGCRAG